MLGNVAIIRKCTSCKAAHSPATRLFFGVKLKVGMHANRSAFGKISFDVTKNKKDLTFLSNIKHSR